jgi:predicted dehydrogenase
MSRRWIEAVQDGDDFEFVAFVDLNIEGARKQAETYGLTSLPCYTQLDEALKAVQADVVFDCTVPEAHFEVTMTALKAGCHVLGEKPMADSIESAWEMVATAKASGKLYAVIQNYRYNKDIRTVANAIQAGLIGRVHTLNADFYVGPHFGGFRDAMDHVLLLDMSIHHFDMGRFLSGANPLTVYCKEYNPPGSWYAHGASATAIFEMSNEVVFNYRGSWCAEGLATGWNCEWRIIGNKGTLRWDGGGDIRIERPLAGEGWMRDVEQVEVPAIQWDEEHNSHKGLIFEFAESIRTGKPPMTHCDDNIKSLAMVFAAIESAERQINVSIST